MSKELKDSALNSIKLLNKKTQRPEESREKIESNHPIIETYERNKVHQNDDVFKENETNLNDSNNLPQNKIYNHLDIQNPNEINPKEFNINKEDNISNLDENIKQKLSNDNQTLSIKEKENPILIDKINSEPIPEQRKISVEVQPLNQKLEQSYTQQNMEIDNKTEQNNYKSFQVKEKEIALDLKDNSKIQNNLNNQNVAEPKREEEKDTKKITYTQAKKEISEFKEKIDQIELELNNRYGIKFAEFNYDELFQEEFNMKIIDEYFKDKKA
jgi:hypothetical protein